MLITSYSEEILCRVTRFNLITRLFISFITTDQSKLVQDTTSLRENIEAELYFLLSINMIKVEFLVSEHKVDYAPIEPSESEFDVEAGVLGGPLLRIINLVDLLQETKVLSVCVPGVLERCLIVLVHPD